MKLLDAIPSIPSIQMAHQSKTFTARELRTDTVIVFYFWSSDCTLCKKLPKFSEQLAKVYGDEVQFIAIHDGEIEDWDVPIIEAESLIDSDKVVSSRFGVRLYPAIYVFDREHRLRFWQSGSANTHMLLKRIEKFVAP